MALRWRRPRPNQLFMAQRSLFTGARKTFSAGPLPGLNTGLPAYSRAVSSPVFLVEDGSETLAGNGGELAVAGHGGPVAGRGERGFGVPLRVFHGELFGGDLVAGRSHDRVGRGAETDAQAVVDAGLGDQRRERQFHLQPRARRDGRSGQFAGADHGAIARELPRQVVSGKVFEEEFVEDFDFADFAGIRGDGDVLVHLLHFPEIGLRVAVGVQDALDDELSVVGKVAEIASVGDELAAVPGRLFETLVAPFPDAGAEDVVGLLDGVPVVGEVAHAVVHDVRVLRDVEGLFIALLGGLGVGPADARILVRVHVHDVVVALVVRGAREVARLDRRVAGDEVLARARLVAERPDGDGRVVFVALDHGHDAVDVRGLPLLRVRERFLAVVITVRLDVRLVHEVHAVLVAEVVPVRVVRVVRGTHMVHVRLLEALHVELHVGARERVTGLGEILVTVHALEFHGLAVHEEHAVDDLHVAETDVRGDDVTDLAAGVGELDDQRIEIRRLGGPEGRMGVVMNDHHFAVGTLLCCNGKRGNFLARFVVEHGVHSDAFSVARGGLADVHGGAEFPWPAFFGHRRRRRHEQVAHMRLVLRVDRHRAEDAGEAPHVLIIPDTNRRRIGTPRRRRHSFRASGIA